MILCLKFYICNLSVNHTILPFSILSEAMQFIFTGRMPQSGKLLVLNLLTGQKSAFSPRNSEWLVAPIHAKFGMTTGHMGPLGHTKFHANQFTWPPKYQKFPLFGKELPHTFLEGLLQKPPSSSDLPLIGPRPWRHMLWLFRSLLKIFEYAAKQACKQLQCNKAKLSEPASINGLQI